MGTGKSPVPLTATEKRIKNYLRKDRMVTPKGIKKGLKTKRAHLAKTVQLCQEAALQRDAREKSRWKSLERRLNFPRNGKGKKREGSGGPGGEEHLKRGGNRQGTEKTGPMHTKRVFTGAPPLWNLDMSPWNEGTRKRGGCNLGSGTDQKWLMRVLLKVFDGGGKPRPRDNQGGLHPRRPQNFLWAFHEKQNCQQRRLGASRGRGKEKGWGIKSPFPNRLARASGEKKRKTRLVKEYSIWPKKKKKKKKRLDLPTNKAVRCKRSWGGETGQKIKEIFRTRGEVGIRSKKRKRGKVKGW